MDVFFSTATFFPNANESIAIQQPASAETNRGRDDGGRNVVSRRSRFIPGTTGTPSGMYSKIYVQNTILSEIGMVQEAIRTHQRSEGGVPMKYSG